MKHIRAPPGHQLIKEGVCQEGDKIWSSHAADWLDISVSVGKPITPTDHVARPIPEASQEDLNHLFGIKTYKPKTQTEDHW